MNKTANKYYQSHRKQLSHANFDKRLPTTQMLRQRSFDDDYKTEQLIRNNSITSTNWCIFDINCNFFLGVKQNHQREVASLTKIMTTIIGIELFEKYQMEKDILVRVSSSAASHSGTTANLKAGKYIKIYDLFYGTMLPSGNDAAFLLAQIFGLLLFYESVKPESKDYSQIQSIDLTCYQSTTTFINRFLKQMNKKAKELKMSKTVFTNPHGLANISNISTAKDILALSKYCYGNKSFKHITNCEQFTSTFYQEDMTQVYCDKKWKNTNKLLGLGWEGIKTGHTSPAGACLSSVRDGVFIVILNSSNQQSRFQDTINLWQWYKNNNNHDNQ